MRYTNPRLLYFTLLYHVDSSIDHKVTSSIVIILKIEVSSRQPMGTPFSNPEKGPESEENDPCPLSGGWLRACSEVSM